MTVRNRLRALLVNRLRRSGLIVISNAGKTTSSATTVVPKTATTLNR